MEVFFQVDFLDAGKPTATIPVYAPNHPGFNAHIISFSLIKHSRRYYRQPETHTSRNPTIYSLFSVLKSLRATSRRLVMVFSPSRTQTRGSKNFLLGLSAPSGLPTVVRR